MKIRVKCSVLHCHLSYLEEMPCFPSKISYQPLSANFQVFLSPLSPPPSTSRRGGEGGSPAITTKMFNILLLLLFQYLQKHIKIQHRAKLQGLHHQQFQLQVLQRRQFQHPQSHQLGPQQVYHTPPQRHQHHQNLLSLIIQIIKPRKFALLLKALFC